MKAKIFFENEAEKKAYVEACDHDFEDRLDRVMKEVCREDMKFLTLSGPTCSGKTTASKKLISEFSERGKKVKIFTLTTSIQHYIVYSCQCSKVKMFKNK